jgi:hypothetical protein
VLSLAGREADVVSLSNVVAPGADPGVEIPRQLGFVRDAAGERFDSLGFELMATYMEVTDDIEGGLARAAAVFGVDPEFLRGHPLVLVGPVEAIADQVVARREIYRINYATVPYHFLESFAPVVERLAGR